MARKCGHCRSASTFTMGDSSYGCYECGLQSSLIDGSPIAAKTEDEDDS